MLNRPEHARLCELIATRVVELGASVVRRRRRNVSHMTASSSVGARRASARRPRLRAVRQPVGCSVSAPLSTPCARAEVAVDVVDELLGLEVGVVVREGPPRRGRSRGCAGRTSRSRIRALERLVRRRRLVQAAGLGSKSWMLKLYGSVAVPADDVEGMVIEHAALVPAARAHQQLELPSPRWCSSYSRGRKSRW